VRSCAEPVIPASLQLDCLAGESLIFPIAGLKKMKNFVTAFVVKSVD
jgi:hypothetical protein